MKIEKETGFLLPDGYRDRCISNIFFADQNVKTAAGADGK